ncbi:ABC transporter permease [Actinoplanes subtropicus]|uniref:ABC transporter permease n=1 Tax=Actinoplanes subtropicus TaxID=543632 RepID=UPI00068A31DB|nr:ABC transporter permease [Actinoplanes subtropicus]
MTLLRRARTTGGPLVLLGLLAFLAALLVTGLPRLANDYLDRGLRHDVARLPSTERDLTFVSRPHRYRPAPADPESLPAPLPGLVDQDWLTVRVGPTGVQASGDSGRFATRCPPVMSVRWITGADREITIVSGRAPASGNGVEAMASRATAQATGLTVGSTFRLSGSTAGLSPVPVRVVGIYAERDPAAPTWDDLHPEPVACPSDPDNTTTVSAGLLTDVAGLAALAKGTGEVTGEWRYRLAERRLTVAELPRVTAAIAAARRTPPLPETAPAGSLETTLTAYQREQDAVAALLVIVRAGLLATLLGLIGLVAGLVGRRRADEFALIRARGGTAATVGVRVLAENALVAPLAAAAGGLLGLLLPGRSDAYAWWGIVATAAVTTLTAPVRVALAHRRATFATGRRDLGRSVAPRVLIFQGFLVLLAGLGVLLLRRRGFGPAAGVDPYLALVPVLLAVAAAILARHAVSWPLRYAARLAARTRGAVSFLGLAGVVRRVPGFGSFAVLVVAIATGVFTGVLADTVAQARDRAADVQVGGDARLSGIGFTEATAQRLAAVPGVTAVAPYYADSATVRTDAPIPGQVRLVALDGPAAAEVLRNSGSSLRLPAELTRPGVVDGPVPAVVSPDLAAQLGGGGAIEVHGVSYRLRVVAVADEAPGLEVGARTFVVLPRQALPIPATAPLPPNGFLVAGASPDPAALRAAGDAGQRDYLARPGGEPLDAWALPATTVTTWAGQRADYQDGGVNLVLTFALAAGAAGAVVLTLLTVGFVASADAPARRESVARLWTLGLSARRGRWLLVCELAPMLGAAVVAGGAAGSALPPLIGPALGLSRFTAGMNAPVHVDPRTVAAVLGALAAATALALIIDSATASRRYGR